jgi:hypothetical protein
MIGKEKFIQRTPWENLSWLRNEPNSNSRWFQGIVANLGDIVDGGGISDPVKLDAVEEFFIRAKEVGGKTPDASAIALARKVINKVLGEEPK